MESTESPAAWASLVSTDTAEEEVEAAWIFLEERCRPPVLHFLQGRFEGRRAAEEMEERFLGLLRGSGPELRSGMFRPWVARLLRQFAAHLYRLPKVEPTELGKKEAFGFVRPGDEFDRDWARSLLLHALHRFRGEYPRIYEIFLRQHDRPAGAPPPPGEDLARALELSEAEAERRIARGRERLQKYFDQEVRATVLDDKGFQEEKALLLPFVDALLA